MNTPEKDGLVRPILIFDVQGELVDAGLINDKGYAKSLEQDELWTLDRTTGRLIPWQPGGKLLGLSREPNWDAAEVEAIDSTMPQDKVINSDKDPDSKLSGESINHLAAGTRDSNNLSGPILSSLEKVIQDRKEQMPEGSYTTHLFSQGESKIRKKTGEEAVELLLAQDDEEMVSEAADLLYHMLVLFVYRGIPADRIFTELSQRK